MLRFATFMVLAAPLLGVQAAYAQDLPDDPLGDDTAKPEPTNKQEREALEESSKTKLGLYIMHGGARTKRACRTIF